MKRFLSILASAVMCSGLAMAETDYIALPILRDIQRGIANANQIQVLQVSGAATIGGALSVGGALTVTGTSLLVGNVTLTGDIDIDGGDITCPADLLITPAGSEVHINGGLAIGDTTAVGDNNLKVVGTSLLEGAVTASSTLTVLGKGVLVDSSADVQMVQTTNVTMHAGTVWTNTFPTVFGAAPTTVIITPTELHAAVPFYTAATPSNILVTVEADKDFTLTCIGKK